MPKPQNFKHEGGKKFTKFKSSPNETKEKLGHLPDEMMAYYRQVSATIDAGFDDEDPNVKREFLNNVYEALKDEGVQVSQNQTVSRLMETLFSHSEAVHLCGLLSEFCKALSTVSFDRFASHVFQSLIQYLPMMYDNDDLEDKMSLKSSIEKLSQFVLSQIQQLMTDTYGSHVLRSFLEILGGVHVQEEVIRSHVSRTQRKDQDSLKKYSISDVLSSDFKSQFDSIKDKVIAHCDYADALTDANYCPVLQTVLLILHKSCQSEYASLAKDLLKKTCPPTEDDDKESVEKNLPAIVQDSVGSYLVELLVSLTEEGKMPKLYKNLFKHKLVYFSVHPVANYVLQKFLSCLTDLEILSEVVEEMSPILEDILAVSHFGVITKLAEACKRLKKQQKEFTQAVMKAFHCADPKERHIKMAPLIAAMQTYDMFYAVSAEGKETEDKSSEKASPSLLKSVNIHGSLLLQQMLFFDNPKMIVTSLMSLSAAELSNMASDQCGSHVVDALFNSPAVWDRSKEEFLKKIKGFYTPVACSKNGSRCLEGIWKVCSLKWKSLIAEELMKSKERIESDRFGHFLYKNFALFKFSTRRKEWSDYQSGTQKRKQLLQAILEGNTGKNKKNRKRKAVDDNTKENAKLPAEDEEKQKTRLQNSTVENGGDETEAVKGEGHSKNKKSKKSQVNETKQKNNASNHHSASSVSVDDVSRHKKKKSKKKN